MNWNFYNLLASGSWSLRLGENQSAFCGHSLGKPHGMIPTFQSHDLEALDRLGQGLLLVIPIYSAMGARTEQSRT
jgi:hypothetical protein